MPTPRVPPRSFDSQERSAFSDAWLAGFIDGEGYFSLRVQHRLRGVRILPGLEVTLRADDAAVLGRLQRAFGGSLNFKKAQPPSHPTVTWCVHHRDELRWLLDYFAQWAPRAKKAQDYVIWRMATEIYLRDGGYAPELEGLREQLVGARVFDLSAAREASA